MSTTALGNNSEPPSRESENDDASVVSIRMDQPTTTSILSLHDNDEREYVLSMNQRSTIIEDEDDDEPGRFNFANDIRNDTMQQFSGEIVLPSAHFQRQWIRKNQSTPSSEPSPSSTTYGRNQKMNRTIAASVTVDEEEVDHNRRHQADNTSHPFTETPNFYPVLSTADHLLPCVSLSSQSTNSSAAHTPSENNAKVTDPTHPRTFDDSVDAVPMEPNQSPNQHDSFAETTVENLNTRPSITFVGGEPKEEAKENVESVVGLAGDGNSKTNLSFGSWPDQMSPSRLMESTTTDLTTTMMMSPLSTLRQKAMHVQMEESSAYANRIEDLKQQLEKTQREKDKEMIWRIINAKMVEKLQQQLLNIQEQDVNNGATLLKSTTVKREELSLGSRMKSQSGKEDVVEKDKKGDSENPASQVAKTSEIVLSRDAELTDLGKEESDKEVIIKERDALQEALDRMMADASIAGDSLGNLSTHVTFSPASGPFFLSSDERSLEETLDFLADAFHESGSIGDDAAELRIQLAQAKQERDALAEKNKRLHDELQSVAAEREALKDKVEKPDSELRLVDMNFTGNDGNSWEEELESLAFDNSPGFNDHFKPSGTSGSPCGLQFRSGEIGKHNRAIQLNGMAHDQSELTNEIVADKLRTVMENVQEHSSTIEAAVDTSMGNLKIRLSQLTAAVAYIRASLDFDESSDEETFEPSPCSPSMDDLPMNATFSMGKNLTSEFEQENELEQMEEARLRQERKYVDQSRGEAGKGNSNFVGATSMQHPQGSRDAKGYTLEVGEIEKGEQLLMLESENKALVDQVFHLEADCRKVQEQLATVQRLEVMARNRENIANEKLVEVDKQRAESGAKVSDLNDALEKTTEKIKGLTIKLGGAEQRCHETMEALTLTRMERDDCKNQIAFVIHRLKEVEDASRDQLSKYQTALSEAEKRFCVASQQCEDLSGEKLLLQTEIEELHAALVQRENELDSLQRSYLECNERIAEISEGQASSEELLKTLQDARDAAEGKLAAVESCLQDEQSKLGRVLGDRQHLSDMLSCRTSELTNTQKRVNDMAAAFAETCCERDSLKDEIGTMERQLEESKVAFETQLAQNIARLEEKESQCQSLTRQCGELSEAKRVHEMEIERLQAELSQTDYELNALKRAYVECNERLAELFERNSEYEARMYKLGEALEDAQRKISLNEEQLLEEQSRFKKLRSENDLLSDRVSTLEIEHSQKNEKLIASEKARNLYEQEVDQFHERLKEAESELNVLKLSYLQCNNRLAEVSELNSVNEDRLTELTAAELKLSVAELRIVELTEKVELLHREREDMAATLAGKDSELLKATAECLAVNEAAEAKLKEKDSYIEELPKNLEQVSLSVDRMTAHLVSELSHLRQRLQQSLASPSQEWSPASMTEGPLSQDIHGELRRWKDLIPVTCNALHCVAGRMDVARREIQRLGNEVLSVNRVEAGLHRELDEERQQSHALLEKLSAWNDRNGQVENELVVMQKEFQDARAELTNVQGAMNRLEGEKSEMQDIYEKRIGRLEQEKHSMRGKFVHADELISGLRSKLAASLEELSVVREELVKTEDMCGATNKESEQFAARNEVLNHKCARLREYIRQLTVRCEEWSEAYDKLIRRIRAREGSDTISHGIVQLDQTPFPDSAAANEKNATTTWSQDRIQVQELQKKFERITSKVVELNWD